MIRCWDYLGGAVPVSCTCMFGCGGYGSILTHGVSTGQGLFRPRSYEEDGSNEANRASVEDFSILSGDELGMHHPI